MKADQRPDEDDGRPDCRPEDFIDRAKYPARDRYPEGTCWKHYDGTVFFVEDEGFREGHGAFGRWINPDRTEHSGSFDHNLLDECEQIEMQACPTGEAR